MECANNLKQIGVALHNYHDANGKLPPAGRRYQSQSSSCGSSGNPDRQGFDPPWTVRILPYLEQQNLYQLYDPSISSDTPTNEVVITQFVPVYSCPADPNRQQLVVPNSTRTGTALMTGSYRAVLGKVTGSGGPLGANHQLFSWHFASFASQAMSQNGALWYGWRGPLHSTPFSTGWQEKGLPGPVSFNEIPDGLSSTLLVGESYTITSVNRTTMWGNGCVAYNGNSVIPEARTFQADYDACAAVGGASACNFGLWGSLHGGRKIGANFVRCDGSVHFVTQGVNMAILADMASTAGGEIVLLD
jgi:hypothetical protein